MANNVGTLAGEGEFLDHNRLTGAGGWQPLDESVPRLLSAKRLARRYTPPVPSNQSIPRRASSPPPARRFLIPNCGVQFQQGALHRNDLERFQLEK